mmetsp:Transcript_11570/g.17472  ORF Transcript_11570/g.17472 Transcript_11570/m.17472 type:complete len:97 (+) Transcript_11570:439-729(+)
MDEYDMVNHYSMKNFFSFNRDNQKSMKYSEFIDTVKAEKNPGMNALKVSRNATQELDGFLEQIKLPEFYHEIAELEGITLYQGQLFVDKPHYDNKE